MTTTFTKERVQKLPPDQQEAIAHLVIQQLEARQQLLERARRYRGMIAFGGLLTPLAFGLAVLSTSIPRALPFAVIVVCGLVVFHVDGVNRRLDALLQLMETDAKRAAEAAKSDHDMTA